MRKRITVVVDDEILARVMKRYGWRTKRDAIDVALRRAAGSDPRDLLSLEGIGWEGDLKKMRRARFPEW